MKEWAKSFYASAKWHKCRKAYIDTRIATDGGVCEVCHEQLGYIVHHKEHLTPENINNPDISLSFSNLSYECKECHDRHEGHGVGHKSIGLRVMFDKNGQPLPIPPSNV